jgi:hypothetical protein
MWTELDLHDLGSPSALGWAHPGLAYFESVFYTVDPLRPVIVGFDGEGGAVCEIHVDAREIHGIDVQPGSEPSLWIADPGNKAILDDEGRYRSHEADAGGRVVQLGFDGSIRQILGAPSLEAYASAPYRPTSVVVDMELDSLWVADGYGQNLIHLYSLDGAYRRTFGLNDERLDNPHSIALDRRGATPRLLVSDRGNARILALEPLTGELLGVVGLGDVERPSGLTIWDDLLVVADLNGRVSVFDADDRFVCHLGAAPRSDLERAGWPNAIVSDRTVRPAIVDGAFVSPHDVAVSPDGTLVVCEWVIGGRLTVHDLTQLAWSPSEGD